MSEDEQFPEEIVMPLEDSIDLYAGAMEHLKARVAEEIPGGDVGMDHLAGGGIGVQRSPGCLRRE